ncbi:helix-turn-helix domain-containing protein [Castellaniella hirudinis]|uniref:helix-turn-helix domain-containing protein n=1 Tax=Castellaniella hirudinis TaxID=1144617 RepID=UPI0039C1E559
MEPLTPAPPAHDHTAIPIYKLYGYGNVWTTADPLYCETIAAQEKLHNWHVTAHKHMDLFQILCLESGSVTVVLDGQARTLTTHADPGGQAAAGHPPLTSGPHGHLIAVPRQVVHEFIFQPGASGYILTLTYALLQPLCERHELSLSGATRPAILTLDAQDAQVIALFHALDDEYRSLPTPQRGPLLEALLGIILVWIQRRHQPADAAAGDIQASVRHLDKYMQLIESHYAGQHQVAWYARRIGVTPAHLNSIAQALAGKTALQLIHERLVLEARRELIYTTRPISTIADTLGFADPGYFTRFFKRLAGQAPKDFRRNRKAPQPPGQTTGS